MRELCRVDLRRSVRRSVRLLEKCCLIQESGQPWVFQSVFIAIHLRFSHQESYNDLTSFFVVRSLGAAKVSCFSAVFFFLLFPNRTRYRSVFWPDDNAQFQMSCRNSTSCRWEYGWMQKENEELIESSAFVIEQPYFIKRTWTPILIILMLVLAKFVLLHFPFSWNDAIALPHF